MEYINIWMVIVATILQIIAGMIWYGKTMFIKTWMKISGVTESDMTNAKGKSFAHLYALQMFSSLIGNAVLFYILGRFVVDEALYLCTAVTLWFGFAMTLSLGGVLWENLTNELKVKKFLLTVGYQLIAVLIAVGVLLYWPI